jgi:hypothetical protein
MRRTRPRSPGPGVPPLAASIDAPHGASTLLRILRTGGVDAPRSTPVPLAIEGKPSEAAAQGRETLKVGPQTTPQRGGPWTPARLERDCHPRLAAAGRTLTGRCALGGFKGDRA